MNKEQLRQELQRRMVSMSPAQRNEKSRKACEHLISSPEFQKASTVMMYLPLSSEADVSEAILYGWQNGKTIVVPKVLWKERHMIPVEINSLESGISVGVSGFLNPVSGLPEPLADIDLVVTPGLGFDKSGNRLGRGGAFYDRFFGHDELKAHRCGFAFEEQVVDVVPVAEHDKSIDFLITDERVIYFK